MNNKAKNKLKKHNAQVLQALFFQRVCDEFLLVTQLNSMHHAHLVHEHAKSRQKK